jgi:hypothetical protein
MKQHYELNDADRGATMVVGDKSVTVYLSSFTVAHDIFQLIEKAYHDGLRDGRTNLKAQIDSL